MNDSSETLRALNALREGQKEQVRLSEQALHLMQSIETQRRQELADMRAEEARWRAELRETNQRTLQRYRNTVRVYGALMVMLGAVLALLWINAFSQ